MDLTSRFDRDAELAVLPHDLAVLMVGVAARQAASVTAAAQAASGHAANGQAASGSSAEVEPPQYRTADDRLFRPVSGAFNGGVAAALAQWRTGRREDHE